MLRSIRLAFFSNLTGFPQPKGEAYLQYFIVRMNLPGWLTGAKVFMIEPFINE
jgi:hypothetical protein